VHSFKLEIKNKVMRVMYLGDLHGNFNLIGSIDRFGIKDTHIIQVGDFGLGFRALLKQRT
jgi:hypothetical protein